MLVGAAEFGRTSVARVNQRERQKGDEEIL